MSVIGLHHVQLAIPPGVDDELRAFYGGLLGLTEIPKPPELAKRGGMWFRGPAVELHLGVEDPHVPARKAHPGLLVEDVDALAVRLCEAGLDVRPDDLLPGFRRCYVDDPAGNRLELLEPPPPAP
ncbi:VOC family protein [Bailinhaonella thermotolerans]|uniref:Glyoxalase n=1 Tax=Bailinhaonella thermotolerans TaxID=1070861 RepID=A0A3A4BQ54_9ACTN|nr:VOC family protein [Bailinhaonella thermotolerans]RJL33276.1 glyoxalase [Bailinhaonella thermotolerans]